MPFGAAQDDLSDIGQCFNVIQNTGFLPQACHGREGRTGSGHAAFAFNGGHEGCFLAADKRARALVNFEIEVKARAEDVLAQQAGFFGLRNGDVQAVDGQRIFRAAVNVAGMRADRFGRDDHAFQNRVRIRFQNAAVHERPGIAFIGVA